MKKITGPLISIAIACSIIMTCSFAFRAGVASAQGSDTGAVVVAVAGGSAGSAAPAAIHDPTQDAIGFYHDLLDAKKHGWGVLVLVGIFGLCELLAVAGKRVPFLAFLGKGRVSIVIGAGAAISATMFAAIAGGAAWTSVLVAGGSALLLYLHPAGTDPAKA